MTLKTKAVRDKLNPDGRVISLCNELFLEAMCKNLEEEVMEFALARNLNEGDPIAELGDVIDACYKIAQLMGIDKQTLDQVREDRLVKSGGFATNKLWIE